MDFVAVCDAVLGAWSGSGEAVTEIAERFGVSRGWIWNGVTGPWAMEGLYPAARAAEIHPAEESWMHVEDVVFWPVPVYLS